MKIIGLTGGIGSGKSKVLAEFEKLGVPAFKADDEAKKILNTNADVKNQLAEKLGVDIFDENGQPDRKKLAAIVFKNPKSLAILNGLIHPEVAKSFEAFMATHAENPFLIKEAAILFETGAYLQCDVTILVTAPLEKRIHRVMNRDGASREEVMHRISNQWSDEKKTPLADFLIHNDSWENTLEQIAEMQTTLELLPHN